MTTMADLIEAANRQAERLDSLANVVDSMCECFKVTHEAAESGRVCVSDMEAVMVAMDMAAGRLADFEAKLAAAMAVKEPEAPEEVEEPKSE